MKTFPIKRSADGRALLNLACGALTDWRWNNLDFSPYATLRRHPVLAWALSKFGLVSPERKKRLALIDPEIIRWNLARGIPFPSDSFDAVYHSHFLEHLPRAAAKPFLTECCRVLKPGGTLRIVVPDLETIVGMYTLAIVDMDAGNWRAATEHERAIYEMFDQMVRTESSGTQEQRNPLKRALEKLLRGNADKTGELHRWMWDRHSLGRVLRDLGFENVCQKSAATSSVPELQFSSLDSVEAHPYSLYLEARKPLSAWASEAEQAAERICAE